VEMQMHLKGLFINRRRHSRRRFSQVTKHLTFLKAGNSWDTENDFRTSIKFIYYKNGEKTYEDSGGKTTILEYSGCSAEDKFSFILHGWRQNCDTDWVLKVIERLTYHRGGCIVCIDYGILADASYMWLYRSFKIISNIITERISLLIREGLDSNNGYMFGFSYGGQLATSVGRSLKPHHILKNIDTCDMAGPGFDLVNEVDHSEAAQHVQCLHTSRDKGTHIYTCHQNVRLGNCGYNQPAVASQPYYSSHGLCVQIYINAFDYPFYAMRTKPRRCISRNPALNIPRSFTIGYNENPDLDVVGEIFVPTSLNFPYNLSEKEMIASGYFQTNIHNYGTITREEPTM